MHSRRTQSRVCAPEGEQHSRGRGTSSPWVVQGLISAPRPGEGGRDARARSAALFVASSRRCVADLRAMSQRHLTLSQCKLALSHGLLPLRQSELTSSHVSWQKLGGCLHCRNMSIVHHRVPRFRFSVSAFCRSGSTIRRGMPGQCLRVIEICRVASLPCRSSADSVLKLPGSVILCGSLVAALGDTVAAFSPLGVRGLTARQSRGTARWRLSAGFPCKGTLSQRRMTCDRASFAETWSPFVATPRVTPSASTATSRQLSGRRDEPQPVWSQSGSPLRAGR